MSNYRRLISYIYAYEGEIKGKNIGYAKLEVRNEQCKIQINVKRVFVGCNDMGVYLLSPESEILLGTVFIRNGAGEFRTTIATDNIRSSGCSMDECYGLSVHDVKSTWQTYTTIWEDAVARAAVLDLEDVTSETMQKRSYESEVLLQQQATESAAEITIDPIPAIAQNKAPDTDNESLPPLTISFSEAEVSVSPASLSETVPPIREIMTADRIEEFQPKEVIPPLSDPEELARLLKEESEQEPRMLWDRFRKEYPKILAFGYEHGCEILSIRPQDIGLLPRETWIYGNNSFLLHGYYNYRYLILAKLEVLDDNSRYLLGVPGHYYNNEKYMASMFGFPNFVLAKKQPLQDKRFGYWYRDIQLDE